MDKTKYFVVKKKALPEVLIKVVEAKRLLASERGLTIQEATDQIGISRSSFYKYKDDIFPFHENEKGQTVVSYLKKKGIKKLNILVGTHPDSDHVGGLDDVINNVQVDTVYLPEAKKQTKTYRDVESALKSVNKTAQMPEIGKEYRFEKNVVIRFLGPLKNYKEANNNSLVVQLAYGKNRFLFMGDAEEKAEEDIIKENYDLECDVLKVGHHGSYTATGDNFLTKADPAYAVISAGKDNSYGHPHAATLAKLEDDDVQIYRTDTMGTIEAVSDGNQIHMETEKGKTNE